MDAFTADLDRVTAGTYASRYMDDDEFDWAVGQMEALGHDPERVADALRAWIEGTPMWTCPNCELEHIDEAVSSCPRCDEANPSVVWTSIDGRQN